MPSRARAAAVVVLLIGALAAPASAYTAGSCVPGQRCETWSAVVDNPDTREPERSDQFAVDVLTSATATFVVTKDVALDPQDPYAASGRTLVAAYDRRTGERLWQVLRGDRVYLNTTDAALSPDGTRLYVTGGAYDAFTVAAEDARLTTTAYDTADGRELWTTAWDNRPDDTDNGKQVVVSPDGSEVYVTGITTTLAGDLDWVTLGYDAVDGALLWTQLWSGPRERGSDAPFGLAVHPDGSLLYVTGWSDGVVDFDSDYATVAYALTGGEDTTRGRGRGLGHGRPDRGEPRTAALAWVARYDGVGQDRSDRANAVAVDPDGSRVYVTGDSWAGRGGNDYDYATVAYDARTGAQQWEARDSGGRAGFNSARTVVAGSGRVVVTGQATAPSEADGNDATTVAYDAATGAPAWRASIAPLRHDDLGRDVALSPDGRTAYVLASDTPLVRYTSLARMTVAAYDLATGAVRWQTELDAGSGNALRGVAVAVAPDSASVALAGDVTRSANPLGPPSQDVYDGLVVTFAA